jgi:hypothetical protein
MATSTERKQAKQMMAEARKRGVLLNLVVDRVPKLQWYKADGTPLANLLPADQYHQTLFGKRGMTLYPPENPAPSEPVALIGVQGADMLKAGTQGGVQQAVFVPPAMVVGFHVPDGAPPAEVDRLYRGWLERYQETLPKEPPAVTAPTIEPPTAEPVQAALAVRKHAHHFRRPVGSPCTFGEGCPKVREKPWRRKAIADR